MSSLTLSGFDTYEEAEAAAEAAFGDGSDTEMQDAPGTVDTPDPPRTGEDHPAGTADECDHPGPNGTTDRPDPRDVAANPHINWDGIPDYVVDRTSNEPLYRSDTRDPSVIFNQGFQPKNPAGADLWNYVLTNQPAQYVSTTTSDHLNWGPQYVYDIRAPGGIDINATYGSHSPYPDQQEIAFPGGIKPEYIKGVWQMNPDGTHGQYLPNPNYDPAAGGNNSPPVDPPDWTDSDVDMPDADEPLPSSPDPMDID
ncbi:enterotoxin A family protein [Streptomyces sp. DSM 41014]|uniref:Enterotoxin A family protein n=2 Tax=Streptomyces TaxID=1883 RepID=A0ABU2UI30_9ACTN|nr:enterotoxin A family protein [Streptomyces sp. DSM 41014]MDT0472922.1 enterotoxin A family protein [Streptomyces sp. DSM 41014]